MLGFLTARLSQCDFLCERYVYQAVSKSSNQTIYRQEWNVPGCGTLFCFQKILVNHYKNTTKFYQI